MNMAKPPAKFVSLVSKLLGSAGDSEGKGDLKGKADEAEPAKARARPKFTVKKRHPAKGG